MAVCCGGIVGMGESAEDRLRILEVLSDFDPPPESVPIKCLMAMPGTPLADAALPGRPGALFFRGRELDLLRRQTAHGGKSGGRCGRGFAPPAWAGDRA